MFKAPEKNISRYSGIGPETDSETDSETARNRRPGNVSETARNGARKRTETGRKWPGNGPKRVGDGPGNGPEATWKRLGNHTETARKWTETGRRARKRPGNCPETD